MREIEVDTDVFAAIWTKRRGSEATENQILRRLLLGSEAKLNLERKPKSRLGVSEVSASTEVKTSNQKVTTTQTKKESEMGKIRWVDDIRAVLNDLGGRASLHQIYKAVELRRKEGGRSLPRTLEAVVRRTLEDHSSDSANFRAADLFQLVGRGEWALRS